MLNNQICLRVNERIVYNRNKDLIKDLIELSEKLVFLELLNYQRRLRVNETIVKESNI